MSKTDGGPAFPASVGSGLEGYGNSYPKDTPQGQIWIQDFQGMTLRDYFAAKALLGLFCDTQIINFGIHSDGSPITITERAYELADAMLAERDK